jgi:cation diffusion facilitator family transporter
MPHATVSPAAAAGPASLARFAWLSIAAAIVTIGLKVTAWLLTGSVGLFSDALESLVNLLAAVMTLLMLTVAAWPPDARHPYGHTKAEYIAAGMEGALILLAAAAIGWAAVERLIAPRPLEELGLGLGVSVAASLVNLGVAKVLLGAGRRHGSLALEADARHLLTDVWTTAGVLAGLGAVRATGWQWLDPTIALLVAANIVWTGASLMRRAGSGLLDAALAPAEQEALRRVLARYLSDEVEFHEVLTRQAGALRFVSMHVLVPGAWSVARGHALLERIERDVRAELPNCTVSTHLEAIEDPAAYLDQRLDREDPVLRS